MMNNIVCLCGSTRFKDDFFQVAKDLTLKGYIVLMPLVFGHSGDDITDKQKVLLDQLHLQKISMSKFIYVINKNHYIGESTIREIEYAKKMKKPIHYLEEVDESDAL